MLTDEEIQNIRNRAKLNDNRQIDPMAFAREIERAVMAKAGEHMPVAEVRSKYGDPEAFGERHLHACADLKNFKYGTMLYAHPLPEQAIPEGWREIVDAVAHIGIDFGYGAFVLSQNHIDKARELLSASPKP